MHSTYEYLLLGGNDVAFTEAVTLQCCHCTHELLELVAGRLKKLLATFKAVIQVSTH